MIQLIYTSLMTRPFGADELAAMAAEFAENNRRDDITGLLHYHNRAVVQVLEGPDAAVRALMDRIKVDARHRHVFILLDRAADAREFPDWAMEFGTAPDADDLAHGAPQPAPGRPMSKGLATGLLHSLRKELHRTSIRRDGISPPGP